MFVFLCFTQVCLCLFVCRSTWKFFNFSLKTTTFFFLQLKNNVQGQIRIFFILSNFFSWIPKFFMIQIDCSYCCCRYDHCVTGRFWLQLWTKSKSCIFKRWWWWWRCWWIWWSCKSCLLIQKISIFNQFSFFFNYSMHHNHINLDMILKVVSKS